MKKCELEINRINNIISQIQSTSGAKNKQYIILDNKDDTLFIDVLQFVYNTFIITGLSSKKINKKVTVEPSYEIEDLKDLMDYISKHNTGTDIDIANVQLFMSKMVNDSDKNLIQQIVTKSLKIGVNANTLNKTLGDGFVPIFKLMLAHNYKDHQDKIDSFIVTEKLDGVRALLFINESGSIEWFTRQGKPIIDMEDLNSEAKKLSKGMVYDGEVLALNEDGLNSADLYRKTMKVVSKDGVKENLIFNIFDALPIEEFKNGQSKLNTIERKNLLCNEIHSHYLEWVKYVKPIYIGNDKSKIEELLGQMESLGKEGIMVNSLNGKYECKRSSGLLKVKSMNTVDLQIVDYFGGHSKYEGQLGGFIVDYKGYRVKVGSGFTDEERVVYWETRNEMIGRVCEVSYFEESKNQVNDGLSLRFPVFKGIREEGKEISYI